MRNATRIAEIDVKPLDRRASARVSVIDPEDGDWYRLRYDSHGRMTDVASDTHGLLYTVERYGRGLLPEEVVYADGSREQARFNERGELARLVKRDGGALTLKRQGARWKISDDTGRKAELTFDPAGRLISATTPEGYSLQFSYNEIGLRESTQTSYGAVVRYQYDASGSLFYSQSGYTTGEQPAHTYLFGIDHRVDEVRGSGGDRHEYVYGDSGLLLALRSSALKRDLTFEYDQLARLTRVQYEGRTIEHEYAADETDLAARAAVRSLPVFNQQREITAFPSRFEAGLTRIRAAALGLVTYDDAKHELTLAGDPEHWSPMSPLTRSIAATRIEGLLHDQIRGLQAFTIPSNRLFVPREYESVNCCICVCPEPINCEQQ